MNNYDARLKRLEAASLPSGPVLIYVPNGSTLDERIAAMGLKRDAVYVAIDDLDARA